MLLHPPENALAYRHGAYEVEADKSAYNSKNDAGRYTFYYPSAVKMKGEERVTAHKYVCKARSCDGSRKNWQQRSHTKVYHKDFERKHKSGYRGLEDTGYGSCGTTSYKQHERLVVHTEESSKIGTDG